MAADAEPAEDLVDFWKRTGKKVLWSTLLRHELESALETRPVVLVPFGSVEQHGPACPLDVDIVGAYAVCMRAAQQIVDFDCLVVPPLWYGLAPYNMGWIGTISLEADTALNMVRDVCASIYRHGFTKIIVVNGHGGNVPVMGTAATTLSQAGIFVGFTSIWDLGAEAMQRAQTSEPGRIGHGGEMESSIQLYLRPFLMDMTRAVAEPLPIYDASQRHPKLGLIELQRETRTGVMGDGTAASAAKGEAFIHGAASSLASVARWFRDTERVARGYTASGG